MPQTHWGLWAMAALLAASTVSADTLRLKDGTTLSGTIRRGDGAWVIQTDAGDKTYPDAQVAGIDLTGQPPRVAPNGPASPTTPAANAPAEAGAPQPTFTDAGLASLRRASAAIESPAEVVGRYQRFIDQYKGTPTADEARKDLATWTDRRDRGLVRMGDQWVTPEERAAARGRLLAEINPIREQVRTGDFAAAEAALIKVFAQDAVNPAGWYLRGVIAAEQKKLPRAKEAFEAVLRQLPRHAPSANNLAVILYRQNQHGAAMNAYTDAMAMAPGETAILDNIAEALNSLPPAAARATPAKKAIAEFKTRDRGLADRMAAQGLIRWGPSWITSEDYAKIQQIEARVNAELDQQAGNYDAVLKIIAEIDRDILANQQRIQEIETYSFVRDSTGRTFRTRPPASPPYPPSYFDLRDHTDRLKADRQFQQRQLEALRAQADALQATIPRPTYTGVQKLIGVEGTPAVVE